MNYAIVRLSRFEVDTARLTNRVNLRPLWGRIFAGASRLGDGIAWYALMLVLPLAGAEPGLETSVRMALSGLTCTLLYKLLKGATKRPRPYVTLQSLHMTVPPLDEYSFPSGHTMHAFVFTIVAVASFPQLAWVLVPFTALIALSRMVLGLHYLSDVIAGALIGSLVGWAGIAVGA